MPVRTLIAFYSMSGNTRVVANEIRSAIDADIEEIVEPRLRHGIGGAARALFDNVFRREPPIAPANHDPSDYDVLLLGGPVWAGRMAAPVRTYAKQYARSARRVAFFCTEGARGADKAFADLEALCDHLPEATLAVDTKHLMPEAHREQLSHFTAQLSKTAH
jgi:flavodoxin